MSGELNIYCIYKDRASQLWYIVVCAQQEGVYVMADKRECNMR